MKRIFPLVFMSAFAIMLTTSCKKNYTCTCTYLDATGARQTTTGTINGTKSQATSACNGTASDLVKMGSSSVNCHL